MHLGVPLIHGPRGIRGLLRSPCNLSGTSGRPAGLSLTTEAIEGPKVALMLRPVGHVIAEDPDSRVRSYDGSYRPMLEHRVRFRITYRFGACRRIVVSKPAIHGRFYVGAISPTERRYVPD